MRARDGTVVLESGNKSTQQEQRNAIIIKTRTHSKQTAGMMPVKDGKTRIIPYLKPLPVGYSSSSKASGCTRYQVLFCVPCCIYVVGGAEYAQTTCKSTLIREEVSSRRKVAPVVDPRTCGQMLRILVDRRIRRR